MVNYSVSIHQIQSVGINRVFTHYYLKVLRIPACHPREIYFVSTFIIGVQVMRNSTLRSRAQQHTIQHYTTAEVICSLKSDLIIRPHLRQSHVHLSPYRNTGTILRHLFPFAILARTVKNSQRIAVHGPLRVGVPECQLRLIYLTRAQVQHFSNQTGNITLRLTCRVSQISTFGSLEGCFRIQ